MEKIFEQEELQNRVLQALMWLGFEDVEFEKRFSASKFEAGKIGEAVYETGITYSKRDKFLPDKVANSFIRILEKVIDHHLNLENQKEKLEKQFKKYSSINIDNNLLNY